MKEQTGFASSAAAERTDEVLLSDGRTPAAARPPVRMRRIVVFTVLAAVVVAAAVAFTGALVSRRIAEHQAVHDVAELTDVFADSVVQPVLTDDMAHDPGHARRVLDPIVRSRVIDGSLVRVKLWAPDGTVLYSDDRRLIGQRFPLEDDALAALSTPRTQAEISDLRRPENRLDRSMGKLLEVYRPVWTPNGTPLLFETYFKYDTVSTRSHELWRGFAGITLTSIAALLVLLAPLVWGLVSRARRARVEREQLASWALEASHEERRRIAATLHDGVVQQLAATSFAVAGEAQRASTSGDPQLAARLQQLAGTVRDSIAGLRSLLVDIYPPSLRTSGLGAALNDLARTTSGSSAHVSVDVDDVVAESLPADAREAVFRVAQEALRNAVRHSGATSVRLALHEDDTGGALLTIKDDGKGFDPSGILSNGAAGHFGLHLMADAAARSGARLAVSSGPGQGAALKMWLPRR
jgi:signal transduction histidine kinase